jgi:hypothetical protein
MGSARHEKSFVDFEKPYEQNIIGLKGIVYFGIGLFLLIVITFWLMWALNGVLEDNAKETMASTQPKEMRMTEKEKLPPEPRLQLAPGFQVEGDGGRVILELKAPQAEYWELKKQWEHIWKEGRKDDRTGTIVAMPVDKAKELLLTKAVKARSGPDAEKAKQDSRLLTGDANSGRTANVRRR